MKVNFTINSPFINCRLFHKPAIIFLCENLFGSSQITFIGGHQITLSVGG